MIDRWDQIRLSIAVQHTHKRDSDPVYLRLVDALKPHTVDVVTSPMEGSTWPTYALCLRRTPHTATHRLVLQDDVEVCPGFVDGVREAVKHRPDTLLSFFISTRPEGSWVGHMDACADGVAWSVLDERRWVPSQALVWPVFLIGPMLRFAGYDHGNDDELIARFLNYRGLYALQSMPSLVEHMHHSSTTLPAINMPGPHRAAACWMGRSGEYLPARDVRWDTGAR